jgi:hypothetical protein
MDMTGSTAAKELTLVECLSLARTFAWLVNQSLFNAAGSEPSLAYKRVCNGVGEIIASLDDNRRKLEQLVAEGLDPWPCHVGLPPTDALQRLAEIIVVQKGMGAITIGSSSFTCEAAK